MKTKKILKMSFLVVFYAIFAMASVAFTMSVLVVSLSFYWGLDKRYEYLEMLYYYGVICFAVISLKLFINRFLFARKMK